MAGSQQISCCCKVCSAFRQFSSLTEGLCPWLVISCHSPGLLISYSPWLRARHHHGVLSACLHQGNCNFNCFHAVNRHSLIFSHQEYFVLPSPPHILDCVMFCPAWPECGREGAVLVRLSLGPGLRLEAAHTAQHRHCQTFPAD